MRVQIAARRCEIPETIRTRAEEQLQKLSKYDPGLSRAEVTFEEIRHRKKVEAILTIDRDEPVVAGGEGNEFREALDLMVDRLAKILRRRRSLKTDHKGAGVPEPDPLAE
jgi:ribosomal subunit interface protein